MSVPARLTLVTLGVADVARATSFYEALGWRKSSASQDEVSFFQLGGLALSVFGRQSWPTMPRCRRKAPGSPASRWRSTSSPKPRSIGSPPSGCRVVARWSSNPSGSSGVATPATSKDPDGHLWELAYNPGFPLLADGSMQLPS